MVDFPFMFTIRGAYLRRLKLMHLLATTISGDTLDAVDHDLSWLFRGNVVLAIPLAP